MSYKDFKGVRLNPLFVRFANGKASFDDIVNGFIESTQDSRSKEIAEGVLGAESDLSSFRGDFRELLDDVIANGIFHPAVNYLNSYMEPSILQHKDTAGSGTSGSSRSWISIRDAGSPWVEAVVCYNLALFLKAMGPKKLKRCSSCGDFFTNAKMDYNYCSEKCKRVSE